MQTVNSKVLSTAPDIIAALQIVLQRAQAIIPPNLETPYSRTTFTNPNHCVIEFKDQSISAIITERQHQLGTVLHDISGLQTVMDGVKNLQRQLIKQKKKIIESINLHKRLTSALWRLPTEVLSQIFCHCLPQILEFNIFQPPSKLSAPMLLTRVCRRWREVAVDMPDLWCRLYLPVDDRNWQQAAFCYDSWLKRTRGRPLSLGLQINAKDHSTKLRGLLQPYINQISSLSVDLCHPDPLMMFTDFLALEEMSLHISCVSDSISRSISQLPFTLCSLDVTGWLFNVEQFSTFNPAWGHHLTTVNINLWTPHCVLHLLKLAPNLSSLTIQVFFDVAHALEPFTHTKLHTLHINYGNTARLESLFSNLLNALSLPTLRVLAVHDLPMWPHEELKAFLARSKCPLESLVVSGKIVTDEQCQECVSLVPSLQFVVC